jgi:serine/threonine protein kinase/Flp pilus assembly protein TadD
MSSQDIEPEWTRSIVPHNAPTSLPEEIAAQHLPQIDGYQIRGVLGHGGMGIVYRAVQTKLNRAVALKVLPAMIGKASPSAVARFRREAIAAARLHHTNIVPIYDFGESHDAYYYAMELIEGQPLSTLIPRFAAAKIAAAPPGKLAEIIHQSTSGVGDFPASVESWSSSRSFEIPQASASGRGRPYYQQVARWMADAAEALFYAHSEGIIHRDIKPGNLILSVDARIMIADFGLAKSDNDLSVTVTGALLGTVRYLSPEQAMARRIPVDHRTDIYSLGATMYELLCFEPAFPGADEKQVLSAIITGDPLPPRKILRVVPQELETICLKALERSPDARYASGRAFAEDLGRYLSDLPIVAKRPSLARRAHKFVKRHRAPTVAAVALLLVTGFVSLWRMEVARAEHERAARKASEVYALLENAENQWLTEQNRTKARNLYRRVIDLDPDNAQALGNLASVLREQFEHGEDTNPALLLESINACERAEKVGSPLPLLANSCGLTYAIHGDYEKAYQLFETEAKLSPTLPQPRFNVGLTAYLQQDFPKAEANIRRAIKVAHETKNPWESHPWRELATLQFDLGLPEPMSSLETGLDLGHRGSPWFHLVRARMRLTPGPYLDHVGALSDARNADELAERKQAKVKRFLAMAYLKNGQFDKARAEANAALGKHDLEVFNRLVLAMAEFGLGNVETAKKERATAKKVWPADLTQPGETKRSQFDGVLWFEKSDELLRLWDEASALIGPS